MITGQTTGRDVIQGHQSPIGEQPGPTVSIQNHMLSLLNGITNEARLSGEQTGGFNA